MTVRLYFTLTFSLILAPMARSADALPPTFEDHVRPILKAYCTECHGEEEKPKGQLDLRLKRFIMAGGKSGPGIVTGKPEDSPLFTRARDGEMPPGKKKLSAAELDVLKRWIATGAKAAKQEPEKLAYGSWFTDEDRNWWAFRPITRPAVSGSSATKSPIDSLLLVKLREKKLGFNPEADRLTLIRRVTFDLTGLPPTPGEIDTYLKDSSPNAYEKVVDRLLASPHYGERWGRHWLDVAGYADSEGVTPEDPVRATAWKYRDYVIRSINADKPFDQFIREQIAGDEMVKRPFTNLSPADVEKLTATGFLRMAPDGTGGAGADQKLERNAVVANSLQIVASAFMGMTVACAQCHNHRYDPIPQTDFYRLRAIFEPGFNLPNWKVPAARQVSLYTDADRKQAAELEVEAKKIDAERLKKQQEFIDATLEKEFAKLHRFVELLARQAKASPVAKLTASQKKLLELYPSLNVNSGSLYLYDNKAAEELKKLTDAATAIRAKKPVEEFVRTLTEEPGQVPNTVLFHRGDPDQPKQTLPPGALSILADVLPFNGDKPKELPTTGRRTAFAAWLTDAKNPLTTRVLVNRVWMQHFGRGIAGSPGDFGRLGEAPTHPELLDWLAIEFRDNGWSLKKLHRQILTTQAYRQSSLRDRAKDVSDPDARLLSRFPLRRLDAESVRDAMLAVSGKLNAKLYGKPVPVMEDDVGQPVLGMANRDGAGYKLGDEGLTAEDHGRRSVYVQLRRSKRLAVLDTFDWATAEPNCEARISSTVTPQSLLLMNNDFVQTQSEAFAARLKVDAGSDATARINRAWKIAYGTAPTTSERKAALKFLAEQTAVFEATPPPETGPNSKAPTKVKPKTPPTTPPVPQATPEDRALAALCQALLMSNRFLYVE